MTALVSKSGHATGPRPLHAPYAGRAKPFTIGLAPLGDLPWFEVDARRDGELAQKAAIFAAEPGAFMAEDGTEVVQQVVLARLERHLSEHGLLPATVPTIEGAAPLVRAALLVQDDLIIMREGPEGYRLVAAALCFPSAWSLAEKFGRPMDEIHTIVPGWKGRMAERVARIFDHLAADAPVWRLNWSLQLGEALRRPRPKHADTPGPDAAAFDEAALFVRVERQTLTRLSETGDILFTIKVMLDPLQALATHPDGVRLLSALRDEVVALTPDQLAYKGLVASRDRVVEMIDVRAAALAPVAAAPR
ncbi:MAG: DUF3445 domain-containing protein [Pseudomonadota bacterium]